MVKHYIDKHEGEEMDEEMFAVKVIRYTRSAFERQILESFLIHDKNSKSDILNSKSEYNRCALPRLTSKLGEHTYGEEEKRAREEKKKEEEMEERVRVLRKSINVRRRKEDQEQSKEREIESQRRWKRRKIDAEECKISRTSASKITDQVDHPFKALLRENTDQIDLSSKVVEGGMVEDNGEEKEAIAESTDQLDHK